MRTVRRILIGLVIVVGAIAALSSPTPSAARPQQFEPPNTGTSISPFQCYQASGTGPNRTVTLADQFDNSTAKVNAPFAFCDPAFTDSTCTSESDNDTYPLTCYTIKDTPTTPFNQPIVRVFTNSLANIPFGCVDPFQQDLQVTRPHSLCVPTQKQLFPITQNQPQTNENVTNHFKCYSVTAGTATFCSPPNCDFKFTPGIDNLTSQFAFFEDQFLEQGVKFLRSLYLCAPVVKDQEPFSDNVGNGLDHLLCGSIRSTVSFRSRYVKGYNQFFPNGQNLQLRTPFMGCIPVHKQCLQGTCGFNPITQP
jgi:hypothetical protein